MGGPAGLALSPRNAHCHGDVPSSGTQRCPKGSAPHQHISLCCLGGGGGFFLYAFWGFSLMGLTNCSISNSVSHFLQRNYIQRGAAWGTSRNHVHFGELLLHSQPATIKRQMKETEGRMRVCGALMLWGWHTNEGSGMHKEVPEAAPGHPSTACLHAGISWCSLVPAPAQRSLKYAVKHSGIFQTM